MEILEKVFLGFLLFLLPSCSNTANVLQPLNPETIYKRDMIISVNGITGDGVLVVPRNVTYKLHITAQGDLDLFTFTTCHREEIAEDAANVTERSGIFRRTITKKREIKLDYTPTEIEMEGGCPVFLGGYEEQKGRHSWGLIDFEGPDATLPATVFCNGKTIEANGVSVCQSRAGLIQGIIFPEKVFISPDPQCDLGQKEGTHFKFPIKKGQCVYAFMDKQFRVHRFTTLGYEMVPIRK